jgi:hypothetical protein
MFGAFKRVGGSKGSKRKTSEKENVPEASFALTALDDYSERMVGDTTNLRSNPGVASLEVSLPAVAMKETDGTCQNNHHCDRARMF